MQTWLLLRQHIQTRITIQIRERARWVALLSEHLGVPYATIAALDRHALAQEIAAWIVRVARQQARDLVAMRKRPPHKDDIYSQAVIACYQREMEAAKVHELEAQQHGVAAILAARKASETA